MKTHVLKNMWHRRGILISRDDCFSWQHFYVFLFIVFQPIGSWWGEGFYFFLPWLYKSQCCSPEGWQGCRLTCSSKSFVSLQGSAPSISAGSRVAPHLCHLPRRVACRPKRMDSKAPALGFSYCAHGWPHTVFKCHMSHTVTRVTGIDLGTGWGRDCPDLRSSWISHLLFWVYRRSTFFWAFFRSGWPGLVLCCLWTFCSNTWIFWLNVLNWSHSWNCPHTFHGQASFCWNKASGSLIRCAPISHKCHNYHSFSCCLPRLTTFQWSCLPA